jgi:hypothetical protein
MTTLYPRLVPVFFVSNSIEALSLPLQAMPLIWIALLAALHYLSA